MSAAITIQDGDFEKAVLPTDIPALMFIGAAWCRPSQDLVAVIHEVADAFRGRARVFVVEADRDTEVIRTKYRANRLPVTMLFEAGRVVDTLGGLVSKDTIVAMLNERLGPVINVNEFNFDADVVRARMPVLVHFDAAWCRESQALAPMVDQIAAKFRGRVRVARLEFGPGTTTLCAKWGVNRVPALALFIDGRMEDQILGGHASAESVTEMLQTVVA